jgi:hypothetical protein
LLRLPLSIAMSLTSIWVLYAGIGWLRGRQPAEFADAAELGSAADELVREAELALEQESDTEPTPGLEPASSSESESEADPEPGSEPARAS